MRLLLVVRFHEDLDLIGELKMQPKRAMRLLLAKKPRRRPYWQELRKSECERYSALRHIAAEYREGVLIIQSRCLHST